MCMGRFSKRGYSSGEPVKEYLCQKRRRWNDNLVEQSNRDLSSNGSFGVRSRPLCYIRSICHDTESTAVCMSCIDYASYDILSYRGQQCTAAVQYNLEK